MSKKIALGFFLMVVVVVCCGVVGVNGIKSVSQSLDYVTGPAWDTADGAMEGSIEIEAQVIAASNITAGLDVEASKVRLNDARVAAGDLAFA